MGPDRGVEHSAAIQGHMTPRFRGGSLSSPPFSRVGSVRADSTADNHSGMREIEESGFAAFLDLAMEHPPL